MPDPLAAALECLQRNDLAGAIERCKVITRNQPGNADAWHLMGVAEHHRGNNSEGVKYIRKAIKINPAGVQFHYNLGVLSGELGKNDDAIAAYRETLRLDPKHGSAANNLGNCLRSKGAFGEALKCYKIAVSADPKSARMHRAEGLGYKMIGHLDAAIHSLKRASELDPKDAQTLSDLIFCYQYQEGITAEKLGELHRAWDKVHGRPRPVTDFIVRRDADRQIRLGFVSPDLGHHPVGIFIAPLLERIDRSRFHITAYSDRGKIDSQTERIRASCDQWRNVKGASDEQLLNQIQLDAIDILFDLPGHTDDNRMAMFANRAAPVQMTWGGYVGSTGLKAMDYIVCDRHHVPLEVEPHYTETPLRLAHDYIGYDPPPYAPEVGTSPSEKAGHVTFASMNNPTKINDWTARVWSRILEKVPGSKLMLKYKGFDDPAVQERIHQTFAKHGVGTERLELLGSTTHVHHLERYNEVDVILDPFPYSGGLTTCEALWMGVPTVTLPGDTFASRHSLAHMTNAGFTETVARTEEDYVRLACEWAGDVPRRDELRGNLRQRVAASPLCDLDKHSVSFARELERAWRMWTVGSRCLVPFHELSQEIPPLRVVEVTTGAGEGALSLACLRGSKDAEILTIDPDKTKIFDPHSSRLGDVVGEGGEATLHHCKSPKMDSLLEGDGELMSQFHELAEAAEVLETTKVTTRRLDEIGEARGADLLILDTNGSELAALKGAAELLGTVAAVQVRVYFLPLFKGQPLFAEVDQLLRAAGMSLHKLQPVTSRAIKPFIVNNNLKRGYSQDLWADAVYVRDLAKLGDLAKADLLKLAAILHDLYGSFDLAAAVLGNIGEKFQKAYYKELGIG